MASHIVASTTDTETEGKRLSTAQPKADRANIEVALWTVAVSIGIGLAIWIVAPGAFGAILPSGESAAVHSADDAFVHNDGIGLGMITTIITVGAVAVALFPAIAVAGLDYRGKNFKHAATAITTVPVIVAAVTLFHTAGIALDEFDDRNRQIADSFVSWADARYGVNLDGISDSGLEDLYGGSGFTEVRNPDTGGFVTSYTDDNGTVLVVGTDNTEELPVEGR